MSHGYCPYTTVAGVKAADRFLGPDRVWSGDQTQRDWVERFYLPISAELPEIPEIKANATDDAEKHVGFMRENGWDAQITECKPGQFLTAGVLDLLVKWKAPGYAQDLIAQDGKTYPGAVLEEGLTFWQTAGGLTAACVETETADRVWLAMAGDAPTQLQLVDAAHALVVGQKRMVSCGYLHFPMVDLSERATLDWIVGLSTRGQDGREWAVLQALQQITLKMNHKGARARAADEMAMGPTSLPPPPLVIDRPFMAVFERPRLSKLLYVAHITQESWKDPGDIEAAP